MSSLSDEVTMCRNIQYAFLLVLAISFLQGSKAKTVPPAYEISTTDIGYIGNSDQTPFKETDDDISSGSDVGSRKNENSAEIDVLPRTQLQTPWARLPRQPPVSPQNPTSAAQIAVNSPVRSDFSDREDLPIEASQLTHNINKQQKFSSGRKVNGLRGSADARADAKTSDNKSRKNYKSTSDSSLVQEEVDDANPRNTSNGMHIEEEETKLKIQTVKLVKWLRNRLRKRLEEVANLESDMETERILLENLNKTISGTSVERQKEIRLKLENQKKLKSFHKTIHEPDGQIEQVEEEKNRLSDQLARITRTYETLAKVDKDLRTKLHSAGLSHWLEARGREYMPETAVGVLSKSAEVLEPVTQGIEKAYEIDNQLLGEVEGMVPVLAKQSILSKVLADFALLIPFLPLFVFFCKAARLMDKLSILHVVFYIAAGLTLEMLNLVIISAAIGQEALRACQISNERILSAGVLVHLAILLGLLGAQVVICILRTYQMEIVQVVMCFVVLYHFWQHVFVPAMVGHTITTTVAATVGYAIVFAFITLQKKDMLDLHTPYDAQVSKAWAAAVQWIHETTHAIRNVFSEGNSRFPTNQSFKITNDNRSVTNLSDRSYDSDDMSTCSSSPVLVNAVDYAAPDLHPEATDPTRYARWTGTTAWPIRQTFTAHTLPYNDSQVHGHIAMSRSRRLAQQVQFSSDGASKYRPRR